MLKRIAQRLRQIMKNWTNSILLGVNIRGRVYIKFGPYFEGRIPAYSSEPLNRENFSGYYQDDYKKPYYMSSYNTSMCFGERPPTQHFMEQRPKMDPNDPIDRETLFRNNNFKDYVFMNDVIPEEPEKFSEYMLNEIKQEEKKNEEIANKSHLPSDYSYIYEPYYMEFYNRAVGYEDDPILKQSILELENTFRQGLQKRKSEGYIDVYRGTPKNFQVVDDELYGKEEATKVQAAIQAPIPAELDRWKELSDDRIPLPFTNENLSRWRDKARVDTSADFDPEFIKKEKKRDIENYFARTKKIPIQ